MQLDRKQWTAVLSVIIVDAVISALIVLSLVPMWSEPNNDLLVPYLSLYMAPLPALALLLLPAVFLLRTGWKDKMGTGALLLPLRLALAYEFLHGGMEKLLDTTYLSSPGLIALAAASAPSEWVRAVMSVLLQNYAAFLLLIAVGELLVGLSMLVGGFTRLGALGGVLLQWTFLFLLGWLSVSTFGINFVGSIAFLAIGMLQAGRYIGIDQVIGPRLDKSGNRVLRFVGWWT